MDAVLARLARQSRQEGWNILLVHSIDRLSRGGIVQTVHAVTRLADAGVRLTSYREANMIDLSSPHGELCLALEAGERDQGGAGQTRHRRGKGERCESGAAPRLEGQAAKDAQALQKPRRGVD